MEIKNVERPGLGWVGLKDAAEYAASEAQRTARANGDKATGLAIVVASIKLWQMFDAVITTGYLNGKEPDHLFTNVKSDAGAVLNGDFTSLQSAGNDHPIKRWLKVTREAICDEIGILKNYRTSVRLGFGRAIHESLGYVSIPQNAETVDAGTYGAAFRRGADNGDLEIACEIADGAPGFSLNAVRAFKLPDRLKSAKGKVAADVAPMVLNETTMEAWIGRATDPDALRILARACSDRLSELEAAESERDASLPAHQGNSTRAKQIRRKAEATMTEGAPAPV